VSVTRLRVRLVACTPPGLRDKGGIPSKPILLFHIPEAQGYTHATQLVDQSLSMPVCIICERVCVSVRERSALCTCVCVLVGSVMQMHLFTVFVCVCVYARKQTSIVPN